MKWKKKKLTDFVWFQRGFDLPKDKFINGEFPVVGSTSILGYHSEAKVKAPGIVTGRSGTIGQFQFLKNDFWPHNTSLWVKDFFGNDERFAFYLLHLLDFNSLNGGGAVPSLNRNFLSSIYVNIPPLPTQRRIASILSAYDDLIENNLKQIKLLEETININYKNLIFNKNNIHNKKDFSKIKLNSFVEIISGFPFKSNYYNENGKHKIVTIKNVQDGFFVPKVTDRIEEIPNNMNKALLLSTNDIIMSLTGNVGRVCLVYGDDFVLNQRVVKLHPRDKIDLGYLYALMRDRNMLTLLENLSNGTAQQNLSPIKMGEILTYYPDYNIREDFNKINLPMIELICKLNIQNTKLREARDIMLPRLMSGEIEV